MESSGTTYGALLHLVTEIIFAFLTFFLHHLRLCHTHTAIIRARVFAHVGLVESLSLLPAARREYVENLIQLIELVNDRL